MTKMKVVAVLILSIMLLGAITPQLAVAAPMAQPVNYSPVNGATEIGPGHTFAVQDFSGGTAYATQWQFRTPSGSYSLPLFDTGIVVGTSTKATYPEGVFEYGKTYYWHMRVQNDQGEWSAYSAETSFTVIVNSPPSQPENWEPDNGATGVALPVTLQGCEFRDPNTGELVLGESDTHAASQWQVRASSGNYSSPAFDSLPVNEALTSISVPQGKLSENTTYYWHVSYKDSYGNWSAYSQETSFTTGTTATKATISKPVASFSADKTDVVAGQDLVTFSDNSTPMAEIDLWAWDFGDGSATENWTSDMRPPNGKAFHKYTQAGSYTVKLTVYNGASPSGVEKSLVVVVHAKPEAVFTLTPAAAQVGKEITFTDGSTPTSDITSWEWQFDDGTTVQWTKADRDAAGGQLKHAFKKSDTHTVTLIVKGPLGESYYNKQVNVTGGGGFHFGLWMIAVGMAVVVVVVGLAYLLRARRAK